MATPRSRRAARHRERRRRAQHRPRRLAVIGIVAALALVTLILTAFGSSSPAPVATTTTPAAATDVPPEPDVLATVGNLQIKLPGRGRRGHGGRLPRRGRRGDGAEPRRPPAQRGPPGPPLAADRRIARRTAACGFQLDGGTGTEVLDVGAMPGTDVYSPVAGTVVSISDFVIDGKRYGSRIDVRPSSAPSLIVSLSHVEPDPSLTVGSPVLASSSKLGHRRRRRGGRAAIAGEARRRTREQRGDRGPPRSGIAPVNILFIGDVVGPAREGGARGSPRHAPRRARRRRVRRERRERRRRRGHHPEAGRPHPRCRRGRDHARQPHVAPPGDRAVPRHVGPGHPPGEPLGRRTGQGHHDRRRAADGRTSP